MKNLPFYLFKMGFFGVALLSLTACSFPTWTDPSAKIAQSEYTLLHPPIARPQLPGDAAWCKGVINGRWIGCDPAQVQPPSTPSLAQAGSPSVNSANPSPEDLTKLTPDIVLNIGTVGETLEFDQNELIVKPGKVVLLKFKNNAVNSGMPHNWVLVQPGTQSEVAGAGIAAGEAKNWVPDSPSVLAHTLLIAGGKQDEVKFRSPGTGDYPYICSFPGHYLSMKGLLKVKP